MRLAVLRSGRNFHFEACQDLIEFSENLSDFSEHEIFDLFMIFQYLCVKERHRQHIDRNSIHWWDTRLELIQREGNLKHLESLKSQIGLNSFRDQHNFARNMLDHFWRVDDL